MKKFDFIIGNPPYHYETGRRKIPIYQDFVSECSKESISDHSCFITPDGFVKGGQQLEPFRKSLIENKHFKEVAFHKNPVFSGVSVDAAITVFDNTEEYEEVKKTIYFEDGHSEKGVLDWQYRDVIVNDTKYDILHIFENKIACTPNMSEIIPGRAPFGLNTKCYKSNKSNFVTNRDSEHFIRILVGEEQDFYWINPNDDFSYEGSDGTIEIVKLSKADKWKMVFPKAGTVDKKSLPTRILAPNEIFTDKYLCIFADTEQSAINAEKYFNSKFYRAGLSSKATSWNLYRIWHSNLPVQDFSNNSDIDWSKSPHEIDMQLYRKYNLTDKEIELIEQFIS